MSFQFDTEFNHSIYGVLYSISINKKKHNVQYYQIQIWWNWIVVYFDLLPF